MHARFWLIMLAASEWGTETMMQAALEKLESDPSLDAVEVIEHGGSALTFNRDLEIVESANHEAIFSGSARQWRERVKSCTYVGCTIRHDGHPPEEIKYSNYCDAITDADRPYNTAPYYYYD